MNQSSFLFLLLIIVIIVVASTKITSVDAWSTKPFKVGDLTFSFRKNGDILEAASSSSSSEYGQLCGASKLHPSVAGALCRSVGYSSGSFIRYGASSSPSSSPSTPSTTTTTTATGTGAGNFTNSNSSSNTTSTSSTSSPPTTTTTTTTSLKSTNTIPRSSYPSPRTIPRNFAIASSISCGGDGNGREEEEVNDFSYCSFKPIFPNNASLRPGGCPEGLQDSIALNCSYATSGGYFLRLTSNRRLEVFHSASHDDHNNNNNNDDDNNNEKNKDTKGPQDDIDDSSWNLVCDDAIHHSTARLLCTFLEFPHVENATYFSQSGFGKKFAIDDLVCPRYATALSDCRWDSHHNCITSLESLSLDCSGKLGKSPSNYLFHFRRPGALKDPAVLFGLSSFITLLMLICLWRVMIRRRRGIRGGGNIGGGSSRRNRSRFNDHDHDDEDGGGFGSSEQQGMLLQPILLVPSSNGGVAAVSLSDLRRRNNNNNNSSSSSSSSSHQMTRSRDNTSSSAAARRITRLAALSALLAASGDAGGEEGEGSAGTQLVATGQVADSTTFSNASFGTPSPSASSSPMWSPTTGSDGLPLHNHQSNNSFVPPLGYLTQEGDGGGEPTRALAFDLAGVSEADVVLENEHEPEGEHSSK